MSVNTRPLDIGKLDFEGNRKKRRKKLLLWTSPLAALLVVGILWLVLPFIATDQAITASKMGNHDDANRWLGLLATNTIFEPYKGALNHALVATNQKRFDDAADYFRQAIASASEEKRCFVRVQFVLSTELGGDEAVKQKERSKAIQYYTKALSEITTYRNCFTNLDALMVRISTKLAALYNEIKEETYQDKTETAESTKNNTQTPSDKQLEQARILQQQGEQARQEDTRKRDPNYDYQGKRW